MTLILTDVITVDVAMIAILAAFVVVATVVSNRSCCAFGNCKDGIDADWCLPRRC